jgi:hypothetical protein
MTLGRQCLYMCELSLYGPHLYQIDLKLLA